MIVGIKITLEFPDLTAAQDFLAGLGAPSKSTAVDAIPVESTETVSASPDTSQSDILISSAVQKYADDLGVDVSTLTGSGVNGRITKGDVTAAVKAKTQPASEPDPFDQPPTPVTSASDSFDDDDAFGLDGPAEPVVETYTKEQVRASLVAYQTRLKEAYGGDGAKAMTEARALLAKVGGVDNLAVLAEDKYAAVIAATK